MQAGIFRVLFLNIDMDIEEILVNWISVITKNTNLRTAEINKTLCSLSFTLDGVLAGLLPINQATLVPEFPYMISRPMDTKDSLHSLCFRRNVSHEQRKVLACHLQLYTFAIEKIEAQNPGITGDGMRNELKSTVCDLLANYCPWATDINNTKHEERDVSIKFPLKVGQYIWIFLGLRMITKICNQCLNFIVDI